MRSARGGFAWRVEVIDNLNPRVSVLVSADGYPLDEQPCEFAARAAGLLGIGFYLSHALPERHKLRLGALGRQPALLLLSKVGLDRGDF
jgi:hypothetical protein